MREVCVTSWHHLWRHHALRRLRLCCQGEKPQKMENQQLVSPSRQCSSTPVGSGHGFLSKEQCDNTGESSILSSPGCSWFLPVPLTESELKGRHTCVATNIIKNLTEQLKRLSQNGFQECFHYLYSRWQKCTVAKGGYFEGNVAWIIALFCISQE